MAQEAQSYAVILRHLAGGTACGAREAIQEILLRADSERAIIAHPNLGELLAEAAIAGWRQQQTLEVAIRRTPR